MLIIFKTKMVDLSKYTNVSKVDIYGVSDEPEYAITIHRYDNLDANVQMIFITTEMRDSAFNKIATDYALDKRVCDIRMEDENQNPYN